MSSQFIKNIPMRQIAFAVAAICATSFVQAQEVGKVSAAVQQVEITGRADAAINTFKTNAPLRDIPASISVVTEDVLRDQGALTLDAAIKNISGLTQSSTNNYGYFNNYLARGLQVNFLRDGMPDGPAVNGYTRTLTDVQQVEVLKGPGSAMYGSGAPGGFVNLISKKPELKAAQSVEVGGGSFQSRFAKFDVSEPIDGGVSYRMMGSYANTDGYRGYGNRTVEFIPNFGYQFNRDQTSSIEIRHIDSTIHNDSVGIPMRNFQVLNVPQENRYYTPFSKSASLIDRVTIKHDAVLSDAWTIRGSLAYGKRDLDFLRNVPSWHLDDPITGTKLVNRTWRDQQDRLTDTAGQVEAAWKNALAGIKHEVIFGLAWSETKGSATRKQALLAPISDIFAPVTPEVANANLDEVLAWDRKVKSAQAGFYLQDQMAISNEIKVRAGVRYDRYQITDVGSYNRLFDSGGAFTSNLATNGQSFVSKAPVLTKEPAENTSNKVNPSLGAVYQPTANTSYYVGASSGSFSNFTTEMGRTAFAPETSRQFEIGNKSVFLNGAIASNIALYDTRRNDFFQTANGIAGTLGSSKTRGMDAELTARPITGWQLRLAYAYQDALITKFVNATTKVDDLSVVGKQVAGTSHNQLSLWSTYDVQMPLFHGLGFGGGLVYRDAFYADAANTNRAPAKPVVDLVAYYRQASYDVQFNIGNATNAVWYRYATGDNSLMPGDKRAANLTLRLKF